MKDDVVKECGLHPDAVCTRGHFPGRPIAPGAYLLARVAELLAQDWPDRRLTELRKVKFIKPLPPGRSAQLRYRLEGKSNVRFSIHDAAGVVLEGSGSFDPV